MTNWPDGTRAWLSAENIGIAAAVAIALAIGATLADRPGYGPDEEITWFAVEGIKAQGAPVLPSGLAYFRGPSYSYLAWLAGFAGGAPFEAYRWLGVVFLAVVIVSAARLSRLLFDHGVVTAWLIALAPVAVASGAYARFYMPFAAACTLTLIAATRVGEGRRQQAWFVAGCVAARSLHEFGMLLALVPAAGWLCADSPEERRSFGWLLVITAALLLTEHALLLWLPCIAWNCEAATWGFSSGGLPGITSAALPIAAFAAPAQIASAIVIAGIGAVASYRTIRADAVLTIAAAVAAAIFANGAIAALIVLWSIARPADAGRTVRAGLLAIIVGTVAWIALVALRGNVLVDARLVWGLLQSSFTFPWSGIRYLAAEQPVVAAALVLGVWRGGFSPSSQRPIAARTLAVLLYLELLSFGATGTEIRSRFLVLLLPLMAVFAGAGILWLANTVAAVFARQATLVARAAAAAIAIVTVGYVSVEQASAVPPHRDPTAGATWQTRWSPPVALSSIDFDRDFVKPGDVIVTNDELAAVLLLGRVDFWWPPDPTSAERYSFASEGGGQARGLYGGAPVLTDLSAIRLLIDSRDNSSVIVAVFNTGKFGFDRARLQNLIADDRMVELEERTDDWFVARFPSRR